MFFFFKKFAKSFLKTLSISYSNLTKLSVTLFFQNTSCHVQVLNKRYQNIQLTWKDIRKNAARVSAQHISNALCKERSTHPTIGLMKPSAFFFCSISSAGDGWGRVKYLMNCPNHQTNGSPWRRLSRGAWWQTAQHSTEIGCIHSRFLMERWAMYDGGIWARHRGPALHVHA